MKLSFGAQKDLVVGLDIGSHAVKVCQLKRSSNGYAIVTLGSTVLPEGAVEDGTLNDAEAVSRCIADLFKNLKIKNRTVGFSISGYSVIVKKVNLAIMEDAKLEEHIMAEAEQYIPFDIEDVYLDFQDLKTNTKDSTRTDVMLVAAKKEIVDDYLEMLRSINLNPVIVDVDGFALENSYEYNYQKSENVALIDIGATKMNINIISQGISVVARDIIVGSRQLTEQIMNVFDIEYDEAEAIKLGFLPAEGKKQEVEDIFSSTCTQWVLEIKKAIDLYHSNHPDHPLNKLILSGGGAKVAGLIDFLSQETEVAVELFNPFLNMESNRKKIDPDYLLSIGPEMAIATGIALRPSAI
ncbi:MAG: pilus assembly protein PilM [Proteobacteria bacterium]|nr:pilus assembly protein PilM [Pseudomonadota bacterium]